MDQFNPDIPQAARDINKYTLNQLQELRVHVVKDQAITLNLLNGTCECFGTNMVSALTYELRVPGGYSFFTYSGCEIELVGSPELVYTSNDSTFPLVANINRELEKDRRHSESQELAGPTVLILGRDETGKTSILRTLCHYSLRTGWTPIYADLNVEHNSLSIPGTITATPIELQSKPTNLLQFAKPVPLVYFYGHNSIQNNQDLYLAQCRALAGKLEERLLTTEMRGTDFPGYSTKASTYPIPPHLVPMTKHAGVFIDTPGELGNSTTDENVKLIEELCGIFRVNVILVIDNEPLHAKLLQNKSLASLNNGIAVSRIPRLQGTIVRSKDERFWEQQSSILRYFRGPKLKLTPMNQSLTLNNISIFSTNPIMVVPLTALPLGAADDYKASIGQKLDKLEYGDLKTNSVIALSFATDPDSIATTPVAGFAHIKANPNQNDPVRSIQQPVLYCSMVNAAPPHHLRHFLMGSMTWNDTSV